MMERQHLLRKNTSPICVAQPYLILFYSHSMNQPKDICCLRGKGFKVNIKMGLNQITFADHNERNKDEEEIKLFSFTSSYVQ